MPNEVTCIHVGQAGVQLGNAFWELICLEQGIKLNGAIASQYKKFGIPTRASSFFIYSKSKAPKFIPRAIFVDTENMVIDEIRTGSYRKLFDPSYLISDYEDASNLYPRGYKEVGGNVLRPTIEALRKVSERASNLPGILLFRSFGGGTGSGTAALLLDKLAGDLSKVAISEIIVYPAPCLSTSIVEPYNSVLATAHTVRHVDISYIMDNEAIYNICKNSLALENPSYFNTNKVVALAASSLTVSLRFESILSSDVHILETNIIPFPGLKFPLVSYSPFLSQNRADDQHANATILTDKVFQSSNFLIKCFPEYGEYMACNVIYRGERFQTRETCAAIEKVKSNPSVRFVDWCPTGFKISICHRPSLFIQQGSVAKTNQSICLIANSTSIVQVFDYLLQKFNILYKRRAYIHWLTGEGLEEAELGEAYNVVSEVIAEYLSHSTVIKKSE